MSQEQVAKADSQTGATAPANSTGELIKQLALNVVLPPVVTASVAGAIYTATTRGTSSFMPVQLAGAAIAGRIGTKMLLDVVNGDDYTSELEPLQSKEGLLVLGVEAVGVYLGYQLAYGRAAPSTQKILVGTYLGGMIAEQLQPIVHSILA